MLIDIVERTLCMTSMPTGVLLACGHSPFTLGWKHTPAKFAAGPSWDPLSLLWPLAPVLGGLTSGLIFLPPVCHYPPLTLGAERMYSYCHWTIGPPQGQVQPAA